MQKQLTAKEKALLSNIRSNARETLTTISKRTGIPISTIFEKLKRYEKRFITKHTTIVDFNKLGYSTRATLFLKTRAENRTELGNHLKAHPNINNVFRINNGYDFMAEAIFKDIQELQNFIEQLELDYAITDQQTHMIIEDVAREVFVIN